MSSGPIFDGYRLLGNETTPSSVPYLVWSVNPDLLGSVGGKIYCGGGLTYDLLNEDILMGNYTGKDAVSFIRPITLKLDNGFVLGFRPIFVEGNPSINS